jgi:hypothetical protein
MTKTPHQLAEERYQMSVEFSQYSGELAKLNKVEAEYYIANRAKYKSDTAVKRAFEVTDEGIKMTTLKTQIIGSQSTDGKH